MPPDHAERPWAIRSVPEAVLIRWLSLAADLAQEGYESLEERVVGIRASRVIVRVGALVVRQGEVALGYARLLGQSLRVLGHACTAESCPKRVDQ